MEASTKSKLTIIPLLVLLLPLSIAAQEESYLYNRTNIKIGHSNTPDYYNLFQESPLGNFRLEANYGFFKTIELGSYIGYSKFGNIRYIEESNPNPGLTGWAAASIYSNAFSYGVTANIHILPLFTQRGEPRIDLYISSKIGGLSIPAPELSVYRGHSLDYGMYGGLSLYIARYWGAFAEYGFNKKPMRKRIDLEPCLRYGLTIKF